MLWLARMVDPEAAQAANFAVETFRSSPVCVVCPLRAVLLELFSTNAVGSVTRVRYLGGGSFRRLVRRASLRAFAGEVSVRRQPLHMGCEGGAEGGPFAEFTGRMPPAL